MLISAACTSARQAMSHVRKRQTHSSFLNTVLKADACCHDWWLSLNQAVFNADGCFHEWSLWLNQTVADFRGYRNGFIAVSVFFNRTITRQALDYVISCTRNISVWIYIFWRRPKVKYLAYIYNLWSNKPNNWTSYASTFAILIKHLFCPLRLTLLFWISYGWTISALTCP